MNTGDKMNMLNSLIIEGVIDKIVSTENNSIIFSLAVARREGEISHFKVKAFGKLAKSSDLKTGRELRIVGCLRELQGDLFIIAEYLDFKPLSNTSLLLDET